MYIFLNAPWLTDTADDDEVRMALVGQVASWGGGVQLSKLAAFWHAIVSHRRMKCAGALS